MFIIKAKAFFICDENFTILKNKAMVFDEKIIEINDFNTLLKKYPNANLIKTPQNSLILPAFINPHTHLEFSANSYDLAFGSFDIWLKSVLKSRSNLSEKAKENLILKTIKFMQKTGTGTIGEISSFGGDLMPCVKSESKFVFFNEILGSNKGVIESKKADFLRRFKQSLEFKSQNFTPAISIHSPYSTHPNLAKFALNIAKNENLLVSSHLLESKVENDWLLRASGKFKSIFQSFDKTAAPLYTINDFISLFKGVRTLFTHCVFLKNFELLDDKFHSITHCAFSNRLLSQNKFNLKKALKSKLNIHLGTDGLSSNISLSMLDEMRANLLIHSDLAPQVLAKNLLLMATLKPALALNLNYGSLESGKMADFSVFEIKDCDINQLPLQFILNAKFAKNLFLNGREIKI